MMTEMATTGRGARELRELLHFEQYVNDRFGTSSAPVIDGALLPETGSQLQMSWRRVPASRVETFDDGSEIAAKVLEALRCDGDLLIPVHPLDLARYSGHELLSAGTFRVSASYRTFAYFPDDDDPLGAAIPRNQLMMIKLHLEEPLPGVPGDRRLTRDKVEKCVTLSRTLVREMRSEPMAEQLEIIPEFLGMADSTSGVLFRLLPRKDVLPLFSLSSVDRSRPGGKPLIQSLLEARFGSDTASAARAIGAEFARPLIRSLLAGFRAGFSLEMHAQNALVRPGSDRLVDRVLYRDLEGVVLSNAYRASRGLEPLFAGLDNPELNEPAMRFARYFSRNYDHDLGRVFRAVLKSLQAAGYFDQTLVRHAIRSIRHAFRAAVSEAGVADLAGVGRIIPISRAPYGNGLRLGHYFRTDFR